MACRKYIRTETRGDTISQANGSEDKTTALEVIQGEIEGTNTVVLQLDYNAFLQTVQYGTRLAMQKLKDVFWAHRDELGYQSAVNKVNISKLGNISGIPRRTIGSWQFQYHWFDSWLLCPESDKKTEMQVLWKMTTHSLASDIRRGKLGPREKIVLLENLTKHLQTSDKAKRELSTSEVIRALRSEHASRSGKDFKSNSTQSRGSEEDSGGDGVQDIDSDREQGELHVQSGATPDPG